MLEMVDNFVRAVQSELNVHGITRQLLVVNRIPLDLSLRADIIAYACSSAT